MRFFEHNFEHNAMILEAMLKSIILESSSIMYLTLIVQLKGTAISSTLTSLTWQMFTPLTWDVGRSASFFLFYGLFFLQWYCYSFLVFIQLICLQHVCFGVILLHQSWLEKVSNDKLHSWSRNYQWFHTEAKKMQITKASTAFHCQRSPYSVHVERKSKCPCPI